MAIPPALSGPERFERLVDEATSSLLIEAAAREGSTEVKLLPIRHAARVDTRRGDDTHAFGRAVTDRVVRDALPDPGLHYLHNTDIPGIDEVDDFHQDGLDSYYLDAQHIDVLRTVMTAVGFEEGDAAGITIHSSTGVAKGTHAANVAFNTALPGVPYVAIASEVIAHDPS